MGGFLSALQFLTVIPVKIKEINEKKIANSAVFFPVVGVLLGLLLSGISQLLLMLNFSPLLSSTILAVTLIIITGGMHLDGLADTADAFLSVKPKEEMLAIMRDSHIGVMGVLGLISLILLKVSFLSCVSIPLKITALLLMCALSRWSAVLAMFLFAYARREGKAKVFIQGMNSRIFLLSLIIALIASFVIWGLKGLFILLITAGCTYLFGKFADRKIGGITGDTLGATIELTEIIILFAVSIS